MSFDLMGVDMLADPSTCVNMFLMADRLPTCCVLEAPLADDEAEQLATQLKALSDPTRLKMVSMLATSPSGDLCACDLPAVLGKSQPTVSHHLRLLAEAGLVEREQRGKWAWFRLRGERLAALRVALGEQPA